MSARRGGVYIGLGANLGDPARQLIRALGQLQLDGAVRVLRCSACYRTAPWGRLDQPEFANVRQADLIQLLDNVTGETRRLEDEVRDLEQARTYSTPQFAEQFGSFTTLTSRYGGPVLLKADLELVKQHLYVPMAA